MRKNLPQTFSISYRVAAHRNTTIYRNMASVSNHDRDSLQPTCQNCTTSTTPLWRRDEIGSVLCNACGLFLKLHGRSRPLSLKSDVIKVISTLVYRTRPSLILDSLVIASRAAAARQARRRVSSTRMASSTRDRKLVPHLRVPTAIAAHPKNRRMEHPTAPTPPSRGLERHRCMATICNHLMATLSPSTNSTTHLPYSHYTSASHLQDAPSPL